ncbi:hypothetical protein EVAR_68428_1 [Eumeta japonica]|uniref:Uncharacterized protein n=1 Tax=Eumeta variegata TaxID=151549 RepID=A0A4C1ZWN4_EUMVA|nr:hypothetical protein EVAR_68428_1 [Eumeta japonica]
MNRCVCYLSLSLSLALSLSLLGGLTVLEWKGRVPSLLCLSLSLLGGLTMPEWKGRVPLTRLILGHLQDAGCGSEVTRHIEEGLCTLAHTNKPSRSNHAGEGILDLAIITGLLKEKINTLCRQLD